MSRPVRLLVLLSALALASGCVGAGGSPSPGATTPTATPTSTDTPTATTATPTVPSYDCPYRLHVDRADDGTVSDDERRIRYENLSAERQAEFRAALEKGSTEVGESLPAPWDSPGAVEYRGETYPFAVSVC